MARWHDGTATGERLNAGDRHAALLPGDIWIDTHTYLSTADTYLPGQCGQPLVARAPIHTVGTYIKMSASAASGRREGTSRRRVLHAPEHTTSRGVFSAGMSASSSAAEEGEEETKKKKKKKKKTSLLQTHSARLDTYPRTYVDQTRCLRPRP